MLPTLARQTDDHSGQYTINRLLLCSHRHLGYLLLPKQHMRLICITFHISKACARHSSSPTFPQRPHAHLPWVRNNAVLCLDLPLLTSEEPHASGCMLGPTGTGVLGPGLLHHTQHTAHGRGHHRRMRQGYGDPLFMLGQMINMLHHTKWVDGQYLHGLPMCGKASKYRIAITIYG